MNDFYVDQGDYFQPAVDPLQLNVTNLLLSKLKTKNGKLD